MLFTHHLFWNKTFGARHAIFTGEIPTNSVEALKETKLKYKVYRRWAKCKTAGSGIRLAICKSASHSRQITMPAPHHSSLLQAGCPSCCPTNSVKALKASTQYTRKTFYDIRLANCKQHQWHPWHKKDLTFLVINKSSMRHWTFIISGSNDFYQSCMFFDNKHTRHILLRDKMPSATDLMAVGICWDIVVKYLTDSVYGLSVLTEKVCHNWHSA